MRLEPFALQGRHVRLEPLAIDHAHALVDTADRDRTSFGYTPVPADVPAMERFIEGLLADARRDTAVPFVQRRLADGSLVGTTRFLNMLWWPGRDTPAEVEIGGTWLAADAQRSAINTDAKLLMLTQAFDVWDVFRVAIATDARNTRSRSAIERIGATFEGILRSHRPNAGPLTEAGRPRDTAMHSIIASEWPVVRARLSGWLDAR